MRCRSEFLAGGCRRLTYSLVASWLSSNLLPTPAGLGTEIYLDEGIVDALGCVSPSWNMFNNLISLERRGSFVHSTTLTSTAPVTFTDMSRRTATLYRTIEF
jgi:hypothetical protein